MARLARDGWRVTVLPVSASGLLDLAALEHAVTERTALVSVMAANNEIGVLQPIREAAALAHAKGAWFHTDAVQAAGRVPFDVAALDVDFASVTAHKIYGPKGAGAFMCAALECPQGGQARRRHRRRDRRRRPRARDALGDVERARHCGFWRGGGDCARGAGQRGRPRRARCAIGCSKGYARRPTG